MLFPRRRSARPARLSGAGASPFALDAAALPAAALRALQGQTVFFDGVFKGDYSLAVVNRHLVRALLRQGLRVTCHSPEDGWYGDAKDIPAIREELAAAGRSDVPFEFSTLAPLGTIPIEDLEALAAVGVDRVVVTPWPGKKVGEVGREGFATVEQYAKDLGL